MAKLKDFLPGAIAFGVGMAGYAIYRKLRPTVAVDPNEIVGPPKTLISTTTGDAVQPDSSVTAVDEAATVQSGNVAPPPADQPPAGAPSEQAVPTPLPPIGLTVPEISTASEWTVSWNPSENAIRYVLKESPDGGVTWKTVYSGPETSFTVLGRKVGTYHYCVAAWNATNGSGNSEIAFTKLIAAPKLLLTDDIQALIGEIMTNEMAYSAPTLLDEWVLNNVAKMAETSEVYRILGLESGGAVTSGGV
jgi:hypothetical protein